MTTPLRIGVIGLGAMGRRHIATLRANPGFLVAAGVDNTSAGEAYAAASGIAYFTDHARMLDAVKPDGVIVVTPNATHVPIALDLIARRIPMLLEKPVSDTIESAMTLVKAAETSGVPILVGHHRRHNPIIRTALEFLRTGAVGQMVAVSLLWLARKDERYHDVAWRREPGGGPVLINAIHDVDYLRHLCGEIESVQATASSHARGLPVEDTAAALLRFENGAIGSLMVSDAAVSPWNWEAGARENPLYPQQEGYSCVITGTKGALAIPTLDYWYYADRQGWMEPMTRRRLLCAPDDTYAAQMRHFAEVIRGTKPLVSVHDGMLTLAATLAISRSAASGSAVRIASMLGT